MVTKALVPMTDALEKAEFLLIWCQLVDDTVVTAHRAGLGLRGLTRLVH